MPVQSADIQFRLTGGSGNTNPNASIGGAISSTSIGSGLNNLWDNITGTNHAAGNVDTSQAADYRVIGIRIANPLADASSSNLTSSFVKLINASLGDETIQGALASAKNVALDLVANENTIPTESSVPLTFSNFPSGGLALDTPLVPGDYHMLALRRSTTAGTTASTNTFQLQVIGDTI